MIAWFFVWGPPGFVAAVLIVIAIVWVLAQAFSHKCPACRGKVPGDATKCMHCGTEFGRRMHEVTAEQDRIAREKEHEAFLRKKQAHPWLYWEFSGWKLAGWIIGVYFGIVALGWIWSGIVWLVK